MTRATDQTDRHSDGESDQYRHQRIMLNTLLDLAPHHANAVALASGGARELVPGLSDGFGDANTRSSSLTSDKVAYRSRQMRDLLSEGGQIGGDVGGISVT